MIPGIHCKNPWDDYCGGTDHRFDGTGWRGRFEDCENNGDGHVVIIPVEEYIRLKKVANEYDEESGPIEVDRGVRRTDPSPRQD